MSGSTCRFTDSSLLRPASGPAPVDMSCTISSFEITHWLASKPTFSYSSTLRRNAVSSTASRALSDARFFNERMRTWLGAAGSAYITL